MRVPGLATILIALAALSPSPAWPDLSGPHGSLHGGWHRGGHWHRHSHGSFVFFGAPLFWPGRDPFDDPFYRFPPAPLVAEPPPVYIERGEGSPPQIATPGTLWYYCEAAGAYYPYVKECQDGWKAAAPRPALRQDR